MSGEAVSGLTGSGAEPLEDEDPRRIGPIPLLGRLGAGGMGRVYLGVHEGRYAAVKQVLPSVVAEDKDFLRRFGHELDNLARLPEEATAPLLAGDRDARPPWFATAYVPGITLREAVDLHGPLPAGALWLLLREAAAGLAAVHALDMVHRDLKPSNVMLTLDGATLIDFGVARAAEQSQLTRTGMVVGTPAYMSPEQASGKRASSGVVDVFALGSVLAYAASGRPPSGTSRGTRCSTASCTRSRTSGRCASWTPNSPTSSPPAWTRTTRAGRRRPSWWRPRSGTGRSPSRCGPRR